MEIYDRWQWLPARQRTGAGAAAGRGMGVRESTENEWMAGGSLGVVGDITDVYGYVLPLE